MLTKPGAGKECLVERGIRRASALRQRQVKKRQKNFSLRKAGQPFWTCALYKLIGLEIGALQARYEQTMKILLFIKDILDHCSSMAEVIIKRIDAIKRNTVQRDVPPLKTQRKLFEEKKWRVKSAS